MDLDAIILNESWAKHLMDAEMAIEGFACFRGDRETIEHTIWIVEENCQAKVSVCPNIFDLTLSSC